MPYKFILRADLLYSLKLFMPMSSITWNFEWFCVFFLLGGGGGVGVLQLQVIYE